MGIHVLSPDVNESAYNFAVNKRGEIRFGMGAVKGVGENAVNALIEERKANGPFLNIFDLARRVNLRTVNRRSLEALAMAGAFDTFEGTHRAQYFQKENGDGQTFLEKVLKHAGDYQAQKSGLQVSLFGGSSEAEMPEIKMPVCEPWSNLEQLKFEKEVTGFYMSGHPLDDYKYEIDAFCQHKVNDIREENIRNFLGQKLVLAGILSAVNHRLSKQNKYFGTFTLEDWNDSVQLNMFSEDYLKNKHLLEEGIALIITGTVQKRFRDSDQIEFKISNMSMLSESLEKMTKKITLALNAYSVNNALIEQIKLAATGNKGECSFAINVYDDVSKLNVKMPSRIKTNPRAFIERIRQLPEVSISLS
jgi:DNA polymerase-3 subunit alpha